MKGYMYILRCADGRYYTGSTNDLERRLYQHQNGEGSRFTKARLPVELAYVEEFDRIDDAFRREKQIQGWSRAKKEALMAGDFEKLRKLAASTASTASTGSATKTSAPRLRSASETSAPRQARRTRLGC